MSVVEKAKNKYLIVVTNNQLLNLEELKEAFFLFPVKDFSVGFKNTFIVDEIKTSNAYLFINRILDKAGIEKLESILSNLNKNIIGISFTDLGVISLVKKLNLSLKLIYMQTHSATNALSINYYLEYVDSLLVSTDVTKEELLNILDKASKPLVVPFFGLISAMYSRRKLLENYETHFNLPKEEEKILKEPISNQEFLAVENDFGTVFYAKKYVDYRNINHDNIFLYYINPLNIDMDTFLKIINGGDLSDISNNGFLEQVTIYQLKENK